MHKQSVRIFSVIGALIGWFAILAQLYLIIVNREVSVTGTIFRFFSFFTIDTNIIVALCLTFIFLGSGSRLGIFFSKPTTITPIAIYIAIVGIVYNIILRSLWEPKGMQRIVDELLHSVTPVYFVLFCLIFVPFRNLKWENAFPWLLYPIIYMTYCIIHGAVTQFYPYPFVDVNKLGFDKAMINASGILLVILFLSFTLIGTGKLMKKFDKGRRKVKA